MAIVPTRPRFFATPAAFRRWLEAHHAKARELWVGFHKRHTGKPSLTWPESVDQALCFGWIDGVRASLDADRYAIRFVPRRSRSIWSRVNVRKARALKKAGLMRAAGLAAFAARQANRSGVYSFEQRPRALPPKYAKVMKAHPEAWEFLRTRAPSYQRAAIWWVISAKQEATRERRLAILIRDSASGRLIGPLRPRPGKK